MSTPGRSIEQLRVAVLTRSIYPLHGYGGLERHAYDLVRSLLDEGLSVTLITRPAVGGVKNTIEEDIVFTDPRFQARYVPYRTFPLAGRRGTTVIDRSTAYPLFGARAGRAAAELVRRGEVDLVHGLGASALGYARAHRTGGATAPFVFNPHGLEEFGGTDPRRARLKRLGYRPLQMAVRACARAADRVIATDRALEPWLLTHLQVPHARMRLVPNAIDIERCDRLASPADGRALRARVGIAERDVLFVSAGRIEQNKGFHVLAGALAGLLRSGELHPSWRWTLAGDGPYRPRIQRLLGTTGVGAHTILAGRVSDADLHAWYAAATLFVHPTLYEGSSIVTLEAMAHSRAVVASRAGGLPDKVRPGVNGWLVEPGNPWELGAALRDALSDPARLAVMGMESRRIVEAEFSRKVITQRLLDVYRELFATKD